LYQWELAVNVAFVTPTTLAAISIPRFEYRYIHWQLLLRNYTSIANHCYAMSILALTWSKPFHTRYSPAPLELFEVGSPRNAPALRLPMRRSAGALRKISEFGLQPAWAQGISCNLKRDRKFFLRKSHYNQHLGGNNLNKRFKSLKLSFYGISTDPTAPLKMNYVWFRAFKSSPTWKEHFSVVRRESNGERMFSKTRSPAGLRFRGKCMVLYEVNFQTVYQPIDLIYPIRYSSHFSFIRLSPIVLYPLKSDAVRLIVIVENGRNRCSSIHR